MLAPKKDIVLVAGKRTPFGAFGGSLRDLTATDLAVASAKATLASVDADPGVIDAVYIGNVLQTSADAIYLARHVGLRAGAPVAAPALTLNRLCGSGFEAIAQAVAAIELGMAEVALAGGTESMSQAPHIVRGARWGMRFGANAPFEDSLWTCLTDSMTGMAMANTAEKLARESQIGRAECDAYALQSQQRFAAALAAGAFADELAPVVIPNKRGDKVIDKDEHARPETTAEGLAKLPPVFEKDGCVTAGTASGIVDGASTVLVTTRARAAALGWPVLAQVSAFAAVGCDPTIMGIGPVPAVQRVLNLTGWSLDDVDLVEVNEAFAPQVLAVMKALALDPSRTNVDGGAIAVGHPLAASGTRISVHQAWQLKNGRGKRAIGSACIGGGQGIAIALQGA